LTEAEYITDGTERFGRYFRRKGWFGFEDDPMDNNDINIEGGNKGRGKEAQEGENCRIEDVEKKWNVNAASSRILVEVATAYAITKILLPVRVVCSVWATPWFARVILGRIGGLFGRGVKGKATGRSAAAATGASNGGVVKKRRGVKGL